MALLIATVIMIAVMGVVGIYALKTAARIGPHEIAPAYDPDQALGYVWTELSASARERLGIETVASVLNLGVEYMKSAGAVLNGRKGAPVSSDAVIGAPEMVDFIIERMAEDGTELSADDVHAVIEAEVQYLLAIGAIGEQVGMTPEGRD